MDELESLRTEMELLRKKLQEAEQAAEERRKALTAERQAASLTEESWKKKLDTALQGFESEKKSWEVERTLTAGGFTDPADRKVALLLFEDGGGGDLSEWVAKAKAQPPKQLAHVFQPPPSAPPPASARPTISPAGESHAPASSKITAEQLRDAGKRARSQNATQADRDIYADLKRRYVQD